MQKRRRIKKSDQLYIDKEEMMYEISEYHNTGKISEKLGEMFLKIAVRYTSLPKFVGYSYRDEMISVAVLRMVDQVHKFDLTHEARNPFAYFTMIAYHCALSVLKKEQKYSDLKTNLRNRVWDEICENEGIVNSDNGVHDDNIISTADDFK